MKIDSVDYGQPHTALSHDEMAKIPVGKYLLLSWNETYQLLSAPTNRPRIYGYLERGESAGQIVKLPSTHYMQKHGDNLGFVWLSGNVLTDFIKQA